MHDVGLMPASVLQVGGEEGLWEAKGGKESSEVNSEAERSVFLSRAVVWPWLAWMASSCILGLKSSKTLTSLVWWEDDSFQER